MGIFGGAQKKRQPARARPASREAVVVLRFRRHSVNKGDKLTEEGEKLCGERAEWEAKTLPEGTREVSVSHSPTNRTWQTAFGIVKGMHDAGIMPAGVAFYPQDKRLRSLDHPDAVKAELAKPGGIAKLLGDWMQDNPLPEGVETRRRVETRFKQLIDAVKRQGAQPGRPRVEYYFSHGGGDGKGGTLDAVFKMLGGKTSKPFSHLEGFDVHLLKNGRIWLAEARR